MSWMRAVGIDGLSSSLIFALVVVAEVLLEVSWRAASTPAGPLEILA